MEIINIEARTFEAMMTRFETFAERVDTLCRSNGEKTMQEWLDNQEVCQLLGISSRTLQTMRDNGTMPHTRIGSTNHRYAKHCGSVRKFPNTDKNNLPVSETPSKSAGTPSEPRPRPLLFTDELPLVGEIFSST